MLGKKLDAKSEVYILLDCMDNKQFKLWVPSRRIAVTATDVRVIYNQFPLRTIYENQQEENLDTSENDIQAVPFFGAENTAQVLLNLSEKILLY